VLKQGSPRSHRVSVGQGGVEIQVLEWGDDGPLALLHHANGFCAATWGVVAERLRPHWRVIAIDARGHGNSSRPQGNAAYQWRELTRDWLAVTRWALHSAKRSAVDLVVGNSLGGAVALLAAAERPDWYRRLVLLDPVALPRRLFGGHGGDSPPPLPMAAQARQRCQVWPSRAAAGDAWRDKPMFADWHPRAFESYLSHGLRDREDGRVELACSGEIEAAIFEHTGGVDVMAAAMGVAAPTWVVRAGRGYLPAELFEELCRHLPAGRYLELDGGHLLPMEAPDRVAELLLSLP